MAEGKKLLVGFHDGGLCKSFKSLGRILEYEVDTVISLDEMMSLLEKNEYSRCVMDVNLGFPGDVYIEPAKKVYKKMKERIEKGLAKFMAISGTDEAVDLAIKEGIPSKGKLYFSLKEFLE